ncbi:transposable element Tcb2 transposase [Trichonephila clavipes]|uniref:Transposable element Tcb2 transposase n=1 Tax=Trichonephila clavipes TaxID=2585209 RepID=A0A8X6SKN1_TRICX|nr:transposable element Tcb2 transposase [Trichonephila clavipes]
MMEAGWSARRVARQLSHSDCVVRRFWDQYIREMSFTRRPGSGRPRQTSRREDHHIVRNARVQPTASSAVIQAQNKTMLCLTRQGCHKTVSALLLPFLGLPDPQICF